MSAQATGYALAKDRVFDSCGICAALWAVEDQSGIGTARSENIRSAGVNSLNVFEGKVTANILDVAQAPQVASQTVAVTVKGSLVTGATAGTLALRLLSLFIWQ